MCPQSMTFEMSRISSPIFTERAFDCMQCQARDELPPPHWITSSAVANCTAKGATEMKASSQALDGRWQASNPSQGAGEEVRTMVDQQRGWRPRYDLTGSGPNPSEDGLIIKVECKAGCGGAEDLNDK
jgi:hypothetical protein